MRTENEMKVAHPSGAKAHFSFGALSALDPLRGFPESCPDSAGVVVLAALQDGTREVFGTMWRWSRLRLKPAVSRRKICGAEAPRSLRESTADGTFPWPRGTAGAEWSAPLAHTALSNG